MENAAQISTARYRAAYGKKPRGLGLWYFSYNDRGLGIATITPGIPMNYVDASAWAIATAGRNTRIELLP
jgi:hypothetical protein